MTVAGANSRRGESGQITIMIIAFAVIAALAVGVVVNASAAFLQRRSLASWADGAALAATQSVDHGRLYSEGAHGSLPLSDAGVRSAVSAYVSRHDLEGRFSKFQVEAITVDRGEGRVTVRLSATVPLAPIGSVATAPIVAEASAVAPLTP
jgi:uncharacterized membrane protein